MNRSDLHKLSDVRIREAKILFDAGEYSGAYYLAGYAVECALKACIAKATQQHDFPDKDRASNSFQHNPGALLNVAGLKSDLQIRSAVESDFKAKWDMVNNWSERSRYVIKSRSDADDMIKAVTDSQTGVLQWIKQRW
jgi:hypothetical protein